MKNIMSYLFSVIILFGNQFAQATIDCNSSELSVKLQDLKFLDVGFTTLLNKIGKSTKCEAVKIPGWQPGHTVNQSQGTSTCRAQVGKTYAINPGNPQYGHANLGHLLDNKLGYFFCMPGAKKELMCNEMKGQLASSMDVHWDPKTASGDGDCLCKRKGDSASAFVSCPADPDVFRAENSNECPIPLSEKDGDKCVCSHDKSIVVRGLPQTCPGAPQPQETATVSDDDLEECFTEIKAAQNSCSEKGQAAISKCSKEAPEVNKNISEAQRVLSIGLDALIAKNAGTGALEACAKMGAAGTAVIEALSFMRENCKKELEGCKKGCDDVKAYSTKTDQDYINECKAKFEAKYPPATAPANKKWSEQHDKRVVDLAAQYKNGASNAEKFCKGDVQVADGQLNNFINELGLRVQGADICKCQLTAASVGTENCEAVNNPLTCIQNVNQPGCSFSSVGCNPGSTIPGCRNPIGMTNPNGSGIAMPASGFAGPGFGSTGGGGGAGGKVAVGAGDLSGLYDETRPGGSGTATADAGSPFGSVAGAGGAGGGGGGSGGGAGEGGGAAGEEKEKGGISGFFQNAKGAIGSMFGAGTDNKASTTKKPDNKAFKNDVNGFRPKSGVRGMANSNEFGSKNRDIWKTMNERYNDQYHTFITVESPSK